MTHSRSSVSDIAARAATEAFSPFIVVAAVLLWVAWLTDPQWAVSAGVAVGFVSLIPWAASLVMVQLGLISDRYIQQRRQRHLFYAISLGSMLTGAVAVMVIDTSAQLRWAVGLAVGTLLVVMVINTRVKVSIHALIAALAAVVFPAGWAHPLVILAGVGVWAAASWSRVHLGRHSLIEILWGSLLGAAVGCLFLWVVGVPL